MTYPHDETLEIILHSFNWQSLARMLTGAAIFLFLAVTVFRLGLKRYEAGSAIEVEVQSPFLV